LDDIGTERVIFKSILFRNPVSPQVRSHDCS
jgi:hypothetical protein